MPEIPKTIVDGSCGHEQDLLRRVGTKQCAKRVRTVGVRIYQQPDEDTLREVVEFRRPQAPPPWCLQTPDGITKVTRPLTHTPRK